MKFERIFNTDGTGLWSKKAKAVKTLNLFLSYVDDDRQFGEMVIYFDPRTWSYKEDGLIYTDPRFIAELKAALAEIGLTGDFDYSEQGMQGATYVSFDVYSEFIAQWDEDDEDE